MGWNFRKSIKVGPARVNLSKSGVGYSVGAGSVRYTKRAGSKKKEKNGIMGAIICLFGVALTVFVIMAVAAAIYTFVARFKWIFLVLGILIVAGLITYFAIKRRNTREEKPEKLETIDPAP